MTSNIVLKNNKTLLNALAKHADNPKDFIYQVMAIQNQSVWDLVKNIGITAPHFYVSMCNIAKGNTLLPALCVKISKGLGINPYILNRIIADYNLKMYLNKEKQHVSRSESKSCQNY